jgi:hypothetical protein
MIGHSTQGSFQPHELRHLQAIFDEVVAQPWFPDDAEARDNFAKFLFATFRAVGFPESAFELSEVPRSRDDVAEHDEDIETVIPHLRLVARSCLPDKHAADRLVERTLDYALKEVAAKSPVIPVRQWLVDLLRRTHMSEGALLAN